MHKLFPFFLVFSLAWMGGTQSFAQQTHLTSHKHMMYLHKNWSFHQGGQQKSYPATVPGTVHTDLLAQGLIEDPYNRVNEQEQQWIDKVDWEYWTSFDLAPATWARQHKVLRFEGLDTYADVYLNGKQILSADNFFRSWEVALGDELKEKGNELRIYFHSPIKIGLAKLADHGYALPAVNDQSENGGMGKQRVSIFMRKPGYHFGWDWGPRLVSSGIWGEVSLISWDQVRLTDLYIRQDQLTDKRADLTAVYTLEVGEAGQYEVAVGVGEEKEKMQTVTLAVGKQVVEVPFQIKKPKRWWTHDLGTPHLYEIKAAIRNEDGVLDAQSVRTGLREVTVVQQPDEEGDGRSFYVQLNGVPIFSKGANYIPNDAFIPRVPVETYERVINSARDANMNMLRVWGGGFYEKDIFYQLCDEKGILVWQDFMFACSMYPGDETFLANVKAEAEEQVIRLRNHPCIALWCGNNEIDVAWSNFEEESGWGWKQQYTAGQRREIWQAYDTVFHHLLPDAVAAHHSDLFYWPSSPFFKEKKHAGYETNAGDMHYWGVWHGLHPFSDFRKYKARFMSEYGFQSFPVFEAVKQYTVEEDWDIESEVMASHQRSGIGNLRIRSYMEDHYHIPEHFEHFLYVSQLLQAEGIKMAIEAHRQAMPYCMGTLYWQINDCWPVASWSSMDYYLNWKALHYFAKKAYEPIMVSCVQEDQDIDVVVVSDRLEPEELELAWEVYDLEGNEIWRQKEQIEVAPQIASKVGAISIDSAWGDPASRFLIVKLIKEGVVLNENIQYFVPLKELALQPNPAIQTRVTPRNGGFDITLRSATLVKNLYLQAQGRTGFFSDNFMDVIPGQPLTIHFTPAIESEEPLDLTFLSLVDTYEVTE